MKQIRIAVPALVVAGVWGCSIAEPALEPTTKPAPIVKGGQQAEPSPSGGGGVGGEEEASTSTKDGGGGSGGPATGIACGGATCAAGETCCDRNGKQTCGAPGSCNDAVELACTASSDCPEQGTVCCLDLSFDDPATGKSTCVSSCAGKVALSKGVTTRACESDEACTGYKGQSSFGTSSWDACCKRTDVGVSFCADRKTARFGGYTCP